MKKWNWAWIINIKIPEFLHAWPPMCVNIKQCNVLFAQEPGVQDTAEAGAVPSQAGTVHWSIGGKKVDSIGMAVFLVSRDRLNLVLFY